MNHDPHFLNVASDIVKVGFLVKVIDSNIQKVHHQNEESVDSEVLGPKQKVKNEHIYWSRFFVDKYHIWSTKFLFTSEEEFRTFPNITISNIVQLMTLS